MRNPYNILLTFIGDKFHFLCNAVHQAWAQGELTDVEAQEVKEAITTELGGRVTLPQRWGLEGRYGLKAFGNSEKAYMEARRQWLAEKAIEWEAVRRA